MMDQHEDTFALGDCGDDDLTTDRCFASTSGPSG
jgi:hypothetical protein